MKLFSKTAAFIKRRQTWLKENSKKAFWIWIAYQAIKGTITMTFIWAPLIYLWFSHHHIVNFFKN
ncbi:MAG: hypothetical protein CMH30_09255 [Micavibrio sp.]|nr:hypothetical protein [Micavibrio sp.]|tara:strand:+ start:5312 stop:5506 length:195 start_codon:yes stop_codon:yes gene_type:complete